MSLVQTPSVCLEISLSDVSEGRGGIVRLLALSFSPDASPLPGLLRTFGSPRAPCGHDECSSSVSFKGYNATSNIDMRRRKRHLDSAAPTTAVLVQTKRVLQANALRYPPTWTARNPCGCPRVGTVAARQGWVMLMQGASHNHVVPGPHRFRIVGFQARIQLDIMIPSHIAVLVDMRMTMLFTVS